MPPRTPTLLLDLFATHHKSGQLVELCVRPAGVSADDFALLSYLGRYGPATPTEIGRELGLYLTTTIFRVGKLEKRRLVRRQPNPRDRRSYLLSLTARGEAKWQDGRVEVLRLLERLEELLGNPVNVKQALDNLQASIVTVVEEEEARRSREEHRSRRRPMKPARARPRATPPMTQPHRKRR